MPIFSTLFHRLAHLVSSQRPAGTSEQNAGGSSTEKTAGQLCEGEDGTLKAGVIPSRPAAAWNDGKAKKRKETGELNPTSVKRRKMSRDRYTPESDHERGPILSSSTFHRPTGIFKLELGLRKRKTASDRALMPPPAPPGQSARSSSKNPPIPSPNKISSATAPDNHSEMSFVSTAASRRRANDVDEYDMELARRHAAAARLPPNSGVWSKAEQELFYHLALRGFEPLLPQNWMLDFKTLPLSIFAHETAIALPLIQNRKGTEFRAIRALRDLFETGQHVRDNSLVSPGSRPESVLERAVNKYISWALTDAGVRIGSHSTSVPVHTVVVRQRGQSTTDTLRGLTLKLYDLAAQHRQACGIHASIEPQDGTLTGHEETKVVDDTGSDLPALIGLMIASSVLAVFTLNAHSLPPDGTIPTDSQPGLGPSALPGDKQGESLGPEKVLDESELRFIATFDFSVHEQDVWNALSVAIVAMQIRRIAVETQKSAEGEDDEVYPDNTDARSDDSDKVDDPDL